MLFGLRFGTSVIGNFFRDPSAAFLKSEWMLTGAFMHDDTVPKISCRVFEKSAIK